MTCSAADTPPTGESRSARYSDLLELIAGNAARLPDEPLCLFPTVVGAQWRSGLLVYGRAVNGWSPTWRPSELVDPSERLRLLTEALKRDPGDECPLAWVSNWWTSTSSYNTARSAFWRVARETSLRLGARPESESWSSFLSWGNLYRIAPGITGNPSSKLQRLQFDLCRRQLMHDLAELKPRYVLFMTGWNWAAPFLPDVHDARSRTGLAELSGRLPISGSESARIVVAKHPQGKPHVRFVDAVLDAFAQVG